MVEVERYGVNLLHHGGWQTEEIDMDLGQIWHDEYKADMAEELAEEVKQAARKQAEVDILVRRRAKKDVSA